MISIRQNIYRVLLGGVLFLITIGIHAQENLHLAGLQCNKDSISGFMPKNRLSRVNLVNAEYIAFPIMIGALFVESDKDEFSILRKDYLPKFQSQLDNYSQFLPAAVMLGLKLGGVKGQSSWGRMLTADAFSVALMAGTVGALKHTVKSTRPDGSARNSFPSGHTATAFMAATMLANEYGWRSPFISVGAYTSAALTGTFRMANNRHWLSDVMFGAGIGILSTQMGYFLTDLIYKDKGLNKKAFREDKISESDNPSFFGIYLGYDFPLGHYKCKSTQLQQHLGGGITGLEGAYFFSPNLGIGGRFTTSNICYNEEIDGETIDEIAFTPGVYYSLPLNKNWSVGTKLLAGWQLYTKTIFDGVEYKSSNGISAGTGLSVKYRINHNYEMHVFCDYNITSPYKPFFSNYMNHIAIGGSTSISF